MFSHRYLILFMTSVCVLVYVGYTQNSSDSTVSKILRCFCLSRNFDALTTISKDEIRMMHGMRTYTSDILVAGHYIFMAKLSFVNHLDFEKYFAGQYGRLILHTDVVVDTFFVMSGLLHFRGLISGKDSKPFKILFKRYLRLIVPFALTIVCFAFVLPHLGSGPAWPRLVRQHYEPCAKSWWRILLICNKVDDKEYCILVSWYSHCDFQLTILGTIIFLLYRRSKKRGLVTLAASYILSIVIPSVLNYRNENPGILLYDFGESHDMRQNKVYDTVYVHSYTRAGPYLIGMAMGYLTTVYKPQEYRKVISKAFSIIGFIFGFSLMVSVLQIGANLFEKKYTPMGMALYGVLDRSIWAIGICIIIVVCEYGTLPIINDFLSSKIYIPLSKLSYLKYLWHSVFIYRSLLSFRAPPTFDIYATITEGLGYIEISLSFSYLFWLFFEGPVVNLINLAFENRTSKDSRNARVQNIEGYRKGVQNDVHNDVQNGGHNVVHNGVNNAVEKEKFL